MKKKQKISEVNKRKFFIATLVIFGFMAIEFPGILIVGKMVEPMVFGIPFLYVFIFFGWIYMLLVMFYGYKTEWGIKPFFKTKQKGNN